MSDFIKLIINLQTAGKLWSQIFCGHCCSEEIHSQTMFARLQHCSQDGSCSSIKFGCIHNVNVSIR